MNTEPRPLTPDVAELGKRVWDTNAPQGPLWKQLEQAVLASLSVSARAEVERYMAADFRMCIHPGYHSATDGRVLQTVTLTITKDLVEFRGEDESR
jgi:hypothetical protein